MIALPRIELGPVKKLFAKLLDWTRQELPSHHPRPGILVAKGTGGRLELDGNRLRITKGGWFGILVTLLGIEGGFVERTIRVNLISAIEFDKPAFFFRYVRISYPGAPELTGSDARDMMAENAMLMSLIDNRMFYIIKARIEHLMDRQVQVL
ncbi:MAG: hypothetical protein H7841_02475 [Magnetospirillum sp. WYHS-4]